MSKGVPVGGIIQYKKSSRQEGAMSLLNEPPGIPIELNVTYLLLPAERMNTLDLFAACDLDSALSCRLDFLYSTYEYDMTFLPICRCADIADCRYADIADIFI